MQVVRKFYFLPIFIITALLQAFQVIEMDEYFESFWNAGIRHEYVLSMICVSEHATQVLEQVIGIQDEAKRRDCIKYFARKKYPSGLIGTTYIE